MKTASQKGSLYRGSHLVVTDNATKQRWLPEIKDLLVSYRNTYWNLKRAQDRCIEQVGAKGVHPDEKILSAAKSDVFYVISWLRTGRQPGNRRGVERLAAYQREKPIDPVIIQSYVNRSTAGSPANITGYERLVLDDCFSILSKRERECYEMAHGQGFSFDYIANLLGISKGAVQEYVERARDKVTTELNTKLRFEVRGGDGV